ncbi:hypothetical protein [Streptococcus sanguinis]|jgi:hypothetical protein|uniref:DUF2975 domain-containing protein n=1 Tax=Streptococcus sanguinis TaxID=1305 RepID=A0AAE8KA67_STRSA|nr:hypothetical protein [Streptococcus sanguinis]MBF1698723.1 hypothetical protein [Streptococcus cristatus]RSI09482.1 hypothetical protein D8888_00985 [Streptococcus sanguinis]RSI18222.1 hypothetical protein D8886_04980 [Streptococcus sanguinis]
MKMRILKQVITIITCLVQIFCTFWFLARGFVAIVLIIYNWQSTTTPIAELLRLSYEMIWLGLLPILLFGLIRRFLHSMINHQLFTDESYRLSRYMLILVTCLPIGSIIWDIFIGQNSIQSWIEFVDNIFLPYIDSLALVIVLGVLHLVIKNGKTIQEDVDGFV